METINFNGCVPKDVSGTIAVGGTAVSVAGRDPERRGFWIQNQSAANLWLNELNGVATAASPCILIAPGALYESPDGGCSVLGLSIIGATAGQAWAGRVW